MSNKSSRGRELMGHTTANDREVAIGIDVGGTKIAAGLISRAGELLCHRLLPTAPGRGGEAVLCDVEALARELAGVAMTRRWRLDGIGVSVAELIDCAGEVVSDHTIKWQGLNIKERLSRIAPTRLESDVRAAALAEAHYGAGRNFDLFLYLTVGTGISCCLVQEGRPFAGAHGGALICASSPLTHRCTECGAESRPILEEYAAGPALAGRYRLRSGTHVDRAEQVFDAAALGDRDAKEILETAGAALGVTAGLLINVLDPQAVVVGGGLGLAGGPYWESFIISARQHTWSELIRDIPIIPANLKESAVVGAALTMWREAKIHPSNQET